MELFSYKGYRFSIKPETYQLVPFRFLIDRDKSPDKNMAMLELSYIYFFTDPRSDYQIYVDENERSRQIIVGQGMPNGWQPDKYVKNAIEFYNSFQPPSVLMLKSARKMADEIYNLINSTSLNEKDENGKMKVRLKDVDEWMGILDKIPKVIDNLKNAEDKVKKEIAEQARVRGGAELSIMDADFL